MKTVLCFFAIFACLSTTAFAQDNIAISPIVKKTDTDVCHTAKSRYYSRIKHFQSFKTLDECLKSGGVAFGVAQKK